MPDHYEVAVDPALASLFQQSFTMAMQETGYEKVLEVASPEGPHLWEFKKGEALISLTVRGHQKGLEKLIVESETALLHDAILESVYRVTARFAVAFLKPLSELESEEIGNRIAACLRGLTACQQQGKCL